MFMVAYEYWIHRNCYCKVVMLWCNYCSYTNKCVYLFCCSLSVHSADLLLLLLPSSSSLGLTENTSTPVKHHKPEEASLPVRHYQPGETSLPVWQNQPGKSSLLVKSNKKLRPGEATPEDYNKSKQWEKA